MIPESIAPIGNHLWQSTAFAVAVWVTAWALRKQAAQVRYVLWLAASVKFLVPFSLLMGIGSMVEWRRVAPVVAPPTVAPVILQVAEPFAVPRAHVGAERARPESTIVAVVWLAGFLISVGWWWSVWRRTRRNVGAARPLHNAGGVRVVSSEDLVEPGVFGVFSNVLVLPAGIEERLTPEQLAAVVAHEMCHVRRRDNLAGAVHMFVEAVFWFHPLVRWIGGRLVEERERACDEEVLRSGNAAEAYAEGILKVCRSYVESPMACAAGISGGKLQRRIEAILADGGARRMTARAQWLLAGLGAAVVAAPLLVGMAQESPAFEVASLKPADPNARGINMQFTPGGGVRVVNATLKQIMLMAYGVEKFQISGGPDWVDSLHFDILAKAAAGAPTGERETRLRLQTLLAERFKLVVRRETKEGPVFHLVVAKGGHKLVESDQGEDGLRARPGRIVGERTELRDLVPFLAGRVAHPVLDRTGLTKAYKFKLEWFSEQGNTASDAEKAAGEVSTADPSRPSLFTALQEQLGLKLEPQRGPVETIVIQRVEKPSAN